MLQFLGPCQPSPSPKPQTGQMSSRKHFCQAQHMDLRVRAILYIVPILLSPSPMPVWPAIRNLDCSSDAADQLFGASWPQNLQSVLRESRGRSGKDQASPLRRQLHLEAVLFCRAMKVHSKLGGHRACTSAITCILRCSKGLSSSSSSSSC